jgi:hypothetical protein
MKEALIDLGLFTTEQNLDVLFRQLDKDQSGTLDFEARNLTEVSCRKFLSDTIRVVPDTVLLLCPRPGVRGACHTG